MKAIFQRIATIGFVVSVAFTSVSQTNYSGKLGFGFSPQGHPIDYDSTGAFLQEVGNICDGGVVLANSVWRDNLHSSGQIPNFQKIIAQLSATYGYVDMLNFAWERDSLLLNVPGNTTNNWTNDSAKTLYLKMIDSVATYLNPPYLFLGNEINFYWEEDSTDYLNFVEFYHRAYDTIKAINPNIKVGLVFHYEHLAGRGTLTEFDSTNWEALNSFDTSRIDILGLTVYPFFHYKTADQVSPNHLDPIFNRWGNKPIAITETGWPADSFIGSWTSSPAQQVDYVQAFFDMIDGENVEVVNWLFLHYLRDTTNTISDKLFRSVALRDSFGNKYPAYDPWMASIRPGADFDYTTNQLQVNFSDSSTTNTTSWHWDFGDGDTSETASPSHTYAGSGTYEVCLTASNKCGSQLKCDSITLMSTDLGDPGKSLSISVYPNPAHKTVTFDLPRLNTAHQYPLEIQFFNVQGQMVWETNINTTGQVSLTKEELSKGLYLYRIYKGTQFLQSGKLLIQRSP